MITENLWLQVKHGYHCWIQKLYHSLILASFVLCPVHSSEPFLTPTLKADKLITQIHSRYDSYLSSLVLFSEHGFLIWSVPAAKRQNFHYINNSFYYLLLSYMMWKSSNPILHTFWILSLPVRYVCSWISVTLKSSAFCCLQLSLAWCQVKADLELIW